MKFLAWLFIIYSVACIFSPDSDSITTYTEVDDDADESERFFTKVFSDGSWEVQGFLKNERINSNGEKSWVGYWGEEHRSNNNEVVYNGYVYKDNELIGYEWEDALGITRRSNWG